MRILGKGKDIQGFLAVLRKRSCGRNSPAEKKTRRILDDVRKNRNRAVLKYTRKFDQPDAESIKLSPAEIDLSARKADKKILKALEVSAERIRKFHEMQKENSWIFSDNSARRNSSLKHSDLSNMRSSILGQIIQPLERVGVYVPGGRASYPSTVLMNVIPAKVAGVREIALCVPLPNGERNPYVMAAIKMLGVKEVYRIGGAQAVAALAYGTETIRKVDKIVGPGNIYVATAKKMVFGEVDIDMIAGPSEILIIADRTANAEFIAADLLSQAEHDELASSILVTDSKELAARVCRALDVQLAMLKRKTIAKRSIQKYGAVIMTKNIESAVKLANAIAPEHLEIVTKQPVPVLQKIKNAGAIFIGQWTPESFGDYSAGPNHTLPTGGTARFSSPLGVYDFVKRTSLLSFSKNGFKKLADTVELIADAEGLDAHANTIRVRIRKK